MQVKQITNDLAKSFLNTYKPSSIYQSVEYALCMNKEGYDSILLGGFINDTMVAYTVIFIDETRKYAYAPRGFLIDYSDSELLKEFTKEISKFLKSIGILSIKISPMIVKASYNIGENTVSKNNYYDIIFKNLKALGYRHLGYNAYFEAMKPRYVAMINLNRPYYMIFNSIKKEYRTKIRAASKQGVEIFLGTEENLKDLYKLTEKKYPRDFNYFKNVCHYFKEDAQIFYAKINTAKYLEYTESEYQLQKAKILDIISKMNEDMKKRESYIDKKIKLERQLAYLQRRFERAIALLNEYPDGIIAASALIIKNKKEVTLLMDGYDTAFKKYNAKHLLIWKLLEKYSNEGYEVFHFGGVSAPTLKENKYEGLNQFKTNFDATIIEYIGDLELVVNKTLYVLEKNHIPIPFSLKR